MASDMPGAGDQEAQGSQRSIINSGCRALLATVDDLSRFCPWLKSEPMFGFDRAEIERCYRPFARLSFGLFVVLAAFHLLAISHVLVPPRWAAFAGLFLVFPAHLLMILGVNRIRFESKIAELSKSESSWNWIQKIPWRWRIAFGLLIPYSAWTFFSHSISYPGIVETVNGQCVLVNHGDVARALSEAECLAARAGEVAFITAVGMFFSLTHYLALGYALSPAVCLRIPATLEKSGDGRRC
jgi:hypothetical protein